MLKQKNRGAERAAYQITEEEGVQCWNPSLDEDCSNEDSRAENVSVSPAQEIDDSSFILVMQTADDTDKYTAFMVIQQVYKGSYEKHPRRRIHRGEMKFDQYLPIKLKCPKLFEVDDQINPVLQLYDEGVESRRNNFGGPTNGQFLKF